MPLDTPGRASDGSVTLEPDPATGFVRLRVHGRLTLEAALRAQGQADQAYPGFNRLWDFREADLTDWSAQTLRESIEALVIRGGRGGLRVGALVTGQLEFGIARMFESMAAGRLPFEHSVFRDEASALEWIRGGK